MLHILLIILKIIGILLATVLGIILLLLLLALFVPVRYDIYGNKQEDIKVKARVSWLFRIIYIRFIYEGDSARLVVRIFGYPFLDSMNPRQKKDRSKPKKEERKGRENQSVKKEQENTGKEQLEIKIADYEKSAEDISFKKEEFIMNMEPQEGEHEPKTTLFSRLSRKFHLFKDKLKSKIRALYERISGIRHKLDLILEFWKDELAKSGLKFLWSNLVSLFKHIGPRKIKGKIIFGTGDPYSTGQISAVAAMFYGKYGKDLQICPDFMEKVFECELWIKGRIRLFTLLKLALKVWFHKDVKYLRNRFKALLSGLKKPFQNSEA